MILPGLTLAVLTACEFPASRVKWICPNEDFVQGVGKDRYYRTSFDVHTGLTNAVVRWWFDDAGALFVDGVEKHGPGGGVRVR